MPAPTSDRGPAATRADRVEERFTVPVVVAALASVPATFLTMAEGTAEVVGRTIGYLSLAVFASESAAAFLVAGDRVDWLRRHKLMVGVTLATVPAVLLALGPVQVLRLVRFVRIFGALRVLRAGRIMRAGRILQRRAGLEGTAAKAAAGAATLLAAAFVALVLSDPSSTTRRFLEDSAGRFGAPAVVLAGLLLGGATVVVARARSRARRCQFEDGSEGIVRNTPP